MNEENQLIINNEFAEEVNINENVPLIRSSSSEEDVMGSPSDPDGAIESLGALKEDGLVENGSNWLICWRRFKTIAFCCCSQRSSKLGMWMGVVIPTSLNIFGVILFLRLTMVIGQIGVFGAILEMVVAYTVTGLTSISISAICTNGRIKGGGAYFMLSRSIGPEIGGAVGIVFYLGAVAGGCTYVMGFAESLVHAFSGWPFYFIFPDGSWWRCLYALVALTVLFLIVFVGAGCFADTSLGIFVILVLAMYFSMFSFVFATRDSADGFTSWSWRTLYDNMAYTPGPDPEGEILTPFSIFGIMFPACTGIMAGINLSGDLKQPGRDIPKGTFIAVFYTFASYISFIIIIAFTTQKQALLVNYKLTQQVTPFPLFVSFGIFAAALSSCLSNFIGGAKVLQAVAKDKLLPCLCLFGKGYGRNDEPRIGVIFTYLLQAFVVVFAALLKKDLNWTAPFATQFHIIAYGFTNFACFILSVTGAPNFRPLFKYYHWTLALAGAVACCVTMILCDYVSAAISVVVLLAIIVIIYFYAEKKTWGNITQALIYHQVRKFLLKLDERKDNTKFWRFQPLLLVPNGPRKSLPLILFINNLKKGGTFIIGSVKRGKFEERINEIKKEHEDWLDFITETKIKAFPEIAVGKTIRQGAQNLLMIGGIGAMKPNALIIEFLDVDEVDTDEKVEEVLALGTGEQVTKIKNFVESDPTYFSYGKDPLDLSPSRDSRKIKPLPGLDDDEKQEYMIVGTLSKKQEISEEIDISIPKEEEGEGGDEDDKEDEDMYDKEISIDEIPPVEKVPAYQRRTNSIIDMKLDVNDEQEGEGEGKIGEFGDNENKKSSDLNFEEDEDLENEEFENEALGEGDDMNLTSLNNFRKEDEEKISVKEYVNIIKDGFLFGKSVLVSCHFENLQRELLRPSNIFGKVFASKQRFIDMWIPKKRDWEDHDVVLTLQLGCIINQVSLWRKYHKLRLFYVVDSKYDVGKERLNMKRVLKQYRIKDTEVYAVPLETTSYFHILEKHRYQSLKLESKMMIMNDLMKQFSNTSTSFIFSTLWSPPKKEEDYGRYVKQIDILTKDLPPVLLIHGNENVISINL